MKLQAIVMFLFMSVPAHAVGIDMTYNQVFSPRPVYVPQPQPVYPTYQAPITVRPDYMGGTYINQGQQSIHCMNDLNGGQICN